MTPPALTSAVTAVGRPLASAALTDVPARLAPKLVALATRRCAVATELRRRRAAVHPRLRSRFVSEDASFSRKKERKRERD